MTISKILRQGIVSSNNPDHSYHIKFFTWQDVQGIPICNNLLQKVTWAELFMSQSSSLVQPIKIIFEATDGHRKNILLNTSFKASLQASLTLSAILMLSSYRTKEF